MNDLVDRQAKFARLNGPVLDLSTLAVPPSWISRSPVLNHQPLDLLTQIAVRYFCPAPIIDYRVHTIADKWTYFFMRSFNDARVDLGPAVARLWRLCTPVGLKELLWKAIFHALPIGDKRDSNRGFGLDFCPCGDPNYLDLFHILSGCQYFPIGDLYRTSLDPAMYEAHVTTSGYRGGNASLDTDRWFRRWWFPIMCFKRLASVDSSKRSRAALCKSSRRREWIYGSFIWEIWYTRMRMAHEPDYHLSLPDISASLSEKYAAYPELDTPRKKSPRRNTARIQP